MVFELFFNKFAGILIFLSHFLLILFLFFIFYVKILKRDLPVILRDVWEFIEDYSLLLAFLVVLAGIAGSLIYSEILKIPICNLCWIQRILIYPQIIFLGVALYNKSRQVFNYVLGLNAFGLAIAIYQYIMQMISYSGPCPLGGTAECFGLEVFEFGYITIPLMSITLMTFVLILTYIWKNAGERERIKGANIQKIEKSE